MTEYKRAKHEKLPNACAWCGRRMSPGSLACSIGGTLRQGVEIRAEEGTLTPIQTAEAEKSIPGLVTINGSKAKADGIDIVFMICSPGCAECLRTLLGKRMNIFDKLILVDF
ncbi:MAG: hypothetical protein ACE5JP_15845 [Candidatus Bipolaricaulia bacterium]